MFVGRWLLFCDHLSFSQSIKYFVLRTNIINYFNIVDDNIASIISSIDTTILPCFITSSRMKYLQKYSQYYYATIIYVIYCLEWVRIWLNDEVKMKSSWTPEHFWLTQKYFDKTPTLIFLTNSNFASVFPIRHLDLSTLYCKRIQIDCFTI